MRRNYLRNSFFSSSREQLFHILFMNFWLLEGSFWARFIPNLHTGRCLVIATTLSSLIIRLKLDNTHENNENKKTVHYFLSELKLLNGKKFGRHRHKEKSKQMIHNLVKINIALWNETKPEDFNKTVLLGNSWWLFERSRYVRAYSESYLKPQKFK